MFKSPKKTDQTRYNIQTLEHNFIYLMPKSDQIPSNRNINELKDSCWRLVHVTFNYDVLAHEVAKVVSVALDKLIDFCSLFFTDIRDRYDPPKSQIPPTASKRKEVLTLI